MFQIGFLEIALILILGLIVIGPKKLPELIKACLKFYKKFKNKLVVSRAILRMILAPKKLKRCIQWNENGRARSFCRNQNLKGVILQSVDLLKAGNFDRIKDLVDKAMKVGTETDLGHDYKDDFISRMEDVKRSTVPSDWSPINDLMDGGLGPGELGVVVAPSGVGKTWILTALGASAVRQGLSVVHTQWSYLSTM